MLVLFDCEEANHKNSCHFTTNLIIFQEKTVRVVKLTDITVQPDAVFKIGEEEEDEEGGKGDQEALERGATPPGVLDQSGWVLDRFVDT